MQPRKKRLKNSRMHAALDNMRLFGFSDKNVRLAVKDLLKVYGDDGWVFIEEDSYEVLRETLLEKAKEEEVKEIEYQNENREEEPENLLLEDGEIQECGNGNGNREEKEEPENLLLEGGDILECGNKEEPENLLLEDGEIQECKNGEEEEEEEPENLLLEDGEIQECKNGEEEPENLLLEDGEIQECKNGEEEPKNLVLEDGEIEGTSYTGNECDKDMNLEKICYKEISEEIGVQQYEMPPLLKENSPQAPVEALCYSL